MLYTDAQSQTTGLADTYQLAEAYVQPGAQDLVQAVWFYSRAWNFAPDSFKGSIDKKIKYWYTKYHGGLGGLDAIKTLAAASTFPPANFAIVPAPTAAEKAHKVVVETSDLAKLNPEDIEYILANGSKEDSSKLWGLLQGKVTAVPGVVIGATASVIKVAVSQDAKDAKTADFIVNLKMPLAAKEIPAVGYEFKLAPATALIGTYSTLTQIPATATTLQSAQIVLRDGEVVSGKRAASEKKPAAGHHSAH
jgi:hypothetical protein